MNVGVAFEKPEQFVDDGFQMEFLGGEQGEAIVKVKAHLVSEYADGPRSGTVFFLDAFVENALAEV